MYLLDKEYLDNLLNKANQFCNADRDPDERVTVLYRNKDREYFEDIDANHGGIMTKYLKDNGGDPRCPINGQLEGLFFGVTLYQGQLPTRSPFGDKRVLVNLEEVFDWDTNLYFADFYCFKSWRRSPHYVVLVATKAGTDADEFCRNHLIPQDPQDNMFLRKSEDGFFTLNKMDVWVEIFFTEDIDIRDNKLIHVDILGQGHSTAGGIPKNDCCRTCNI